MELWAGRVHGTPLAIYEPDEAWEHLVRIAGRTQAVVEMQLLRQRLGRKQPPALHSQQQRTAQARAVNGFVKEILACDPYISDVPAGVTLTDLSQLLSQSDVVTLHVPSNAETAHLIGGEELSKMKPTAHLINTARGGLVDEPALHQALINRTIAGAGIDVLASEPPAGGNVLLDRPLPNLIVTPHTAWASRQSRQRLLDQIADNIQSFIEGRTANRVDV